MSSSVVTEINSVAASLQNTAPIDISQYQQTASGIEEVAELRMGPFVKFNPIQSTTVSNFLTHIQSNPYTTQQTNALLENYNEGTNNRA